MVPLSSPAPVATAPRDIRRAAVLGAGVMGAGIAAHLANSGVETLLLDLPSDGDARAGARRDPNRIAREGLARARKARPAAFFSAQEATLVTPGNLDELAALADCDWVIEAVVEDLDIKRALLQRVAPHIGPETLLTTNTSGLSVAALAAVLPPEVRPRFFATHFFNPPRYLKLLEVVPTPDSAPELVEFLSRFAADRLGKGVVVAKDTPNFIANRIGVLSLLGALRAGTELGLGVEAVDALTGPLIGRPKSATYRTADVVGIDVLLAVSAGLSARLPDDPDRALLDPPPLLQKMVEKGLLGQKSGAGFYRRTADREILALDLETLEHRPAERPDLPAVKAAKREPSLAARLRQLVAGDDVCARFTWRTLSEVMRYAAARLPEFSDSIPAVDRAMRWGFGWQLGPFQLWDALGVRESCARLASEGHAPPPVVAELLDSGESSFYGTGSEGSGRTVFAPGSGIHAELVDPPGALRAADRARAGGLIREGAGTRLIDLGDGVALLELTTKMNTISAPVIEEIHGAAEYVERECRGLVIGGDAADFSAGADLAAIVEALDAGDLARVERMVESFQRAVQRLRTCARPVVAAIRGRTLGGGLELALACHRVCAAAETYPGLVEMGAGVVPAGGGLKELLRRLDESVPRDVDLDLFPLVRRLFETVGTAKVATSAVEARQHGFLAPGDRIVMNDDQLLAAAQRAVIAVDLEGHRPPRPRTDIRVLGAPALAALRAGLINLAEAGFITPHDRVVGDRLAWVLCGGDRSGPGTSSEEGLLALERRAFLALCQEPATRDRMVHLLRTGKPLRN